MKFKRITAVIRNGLLPKVEESLTEYGVKGVTIGKVKGFGEYANFFAEDWMSEHVRVDLFVRTDEVQGLVDLIMDAANTGNEGDGLVAVTPVDEVYRIRTRKPARPDEI